MECTRICLGILLFSLLFSCLEEIPDSPESSPVRQSKLARIQGVMQHEFTKTVDPVRGIVPNNQLYETWQNLKQQTKKTNRSTQNINFTWEERGPNNVGGRTRSVIFDLRDTTYNTVLAGSVSGGLWISENFQSTTATWTKVDDFFDNLAVSAIIQDPADLDVFYFGTGEGWFNEDAVRGFGIWKSTDGGDSWSPLIATRNETFFHVQDILIDRNGHLYAATRIGGIQKSEDGGVSWRQVLGISTGNADSDRGADLELGADGDIYATMGFFSIGTVHKSDFASNQMLTGNSQTWVDITPAGEFERIELATAPSDSNRLYILCEGLDSEDVTHIFRSSSGGSSWDSLPVPTIVDQGNFPSFTRGQAWYDLMAAVDPNNADMVFIGAVDALRSSDGGENWEQITTWDLTEADSFSVLQEVHADHHCMVFMPGSSSQAILGTDGGLFFGQALDVLQLKPIFTAKNIGYHTTQFYSCTIFPVDGTRTVMGGTQDNGTIALWAQESPSAATLQYDAGDGGFSFFDPFDFNTLILSGINIDLAITGDFGNNYDFISFPGGRFINPMDYDAEQRALYGAHKRDYYFVINDLGGDNTVDSVLVPEFGEALPSAFKVDPHVENRVWIGLSRYYDSGENQYFGAPGLLRLDSANTTSPAVVIINIPPMPVEAYLSSMDIDPSDPQHLLIAFSNYGIESVWESTNGGASWSSIQGDLPDFPVRWAIFHPLHGEQAFLATEMGVWSTAQIDASSRSATAWVPDNEGLANVRCDMIRYRVSDFTFVVATHGRGLYTATLQVDTMTTLVADQSHESFLPVWPNPATDFVHIPTSFSSNRLIHLAFRNVEGRYLSKEKLQVSPGEILRMPVPAAAIPGIYLITLDDGQEVSTQKLLVN